jgi:hypothetical protein
VAERGAKRRALGRLAVPPDPREQAARAALKDARQRARAGRAALAAGDLEAAVTVMADLLGFPQVSKPQNSHGLPVLGDLRTTEETQ